MCRSPPRRPARGKGARRAGCGTAARGGGGGGGACALAGQRSSAPCSTARSALPRSEDQIRAYFKSGGSERPAPPLAPPPAPAPDLAGRFPPPDPDTFHRWFPGLGLSKTACETPRWVFRQGTQAGNSMRPV